MDGGKGCVLCVASFLVWVLFCCFFAASASRMRYRPKKVVLSSASRACGAARPTTHARNTSHAHATAPPPFPMAAALRVDGIASIPLPAPAGPPPPPPQLLDAGGRRADGRGCEEFRRTCAWQGRER